MRYLIGLLLITVGVALLLQSAGFAESETIWGVFWPVVLIGVGLLSWKSNPRIWLGPLVIVLIGVMFLLDNLELVQNSWWNYFWPAVIILIGLRILLGRSRHTRPDKTQDARQSFAAFSGVDRQVVGPFTSGDITAAFGGVKLDLRQAEIQEGASLNAFAAFGGCEIIVAKNVKVQTNVLPLFGGASDKTSPENSASKTLRVTGTALFGGIEIKN